MNYVNDGSKSTPSLVKKEDWNKSTMQNNDDDDDGGRTLKRWQNGVLIALLLKVTGIWTAWIT